MSWLKIDDSLVEHPKMTRYEEDFHLCLSTWVELGSYCARNLTDGVIAKRDESRFDRNAVELLLMPFDDGPGMLERDGSGRLSMHDYLDYNPSRKQVLHERAQAKLRKERMEERRAEQRSERRAEQCPVPVPLPVPEPKVFEPGGSKTSPLSGGVPEKVIGYFTEKVGGRDPKPDELRSLRTLCNTYAEDTVTYAIGQAVVQGAAPNNFALITTIAKGEAS